jgi:predicted nucleic acid-binding protein
VRAYADSSFILRLITMEPGSPETVAEYRRLGKPPLFFLPLHALEVRNGIRHRAFHQRRSTISGERQHVARERDAAFARLEHLIARRTLLEVPTEMDTAISRAAQLSAAHSERIGARAIDLLHVAAALTQESEMFLTTDERQADLAKAEGLKVMWVK